MSLTASMIFDLIAPVYASDPGKASYLELATLRTSSCVFGANYQTAIALRAAHMMQMRDRGGNAGPVSSVREGDLAIYYGSIFETWKSDLNQTSYGMELKGLIKGNGAKHSVTGGGIIPC
jgi:hypothetical protein